VPGVGLGLARQQRYGQGTRDADALGTGSASLYAHVASRDELIELMADRIAAGVTVPEPDPARWQDQLRAYAQHAQQVWASHADIARTSLATVPTGPERLRVIEGLLAILRAAGFSSRVAAWVVDRLQIFIDADVFEDRHSPLPHIDPFATALN
jgi:AcrR family transcriptional regulator